MVAHAKQARPHSPKSTQGTWSRMSKTDIYRRTLRELGDADLDDFLKRESGLPGPRGNLELLQAVADEADEAQFSRWLYPDASQTPTNTPAEFLAACGAVGLGRLAAEGRRDVLARLRRHASDSRWRVREGVAMGLQRLGAVSMPTLLTEMAFWANGTWLERRAVVAALCEPALLRNPAHAEAVLRQLDSLTREVASTSTTDRRDVGFRVLRQALGYGWSVAVAALPDQGKPLLMAWAKTFDPDVRWIVRENLKKNRLKRLDADWVARCLQQLG
jgi:hypothetical protein